MSQWTKIKILNRKNGKGIVTNAKDDDEVKVTKVLEFIPATSQQDAKEGKTIRFMHNTGDGSVYWLQGTLEKRMNKYEAARKSGWTQNFFRIGSLSIISHWGDRKPLPETATVNLTPNTAWSLGTEVELPTLKEDDLALRLEPGDIPCDNIEDDDETTGSLSVKDDENGASCRTKITPCTNESDSESLIKTKLANDNHEEDASTVISTISDDVSEIRRLRTLHINEWLTDERAQEIIQNVQTVVSQEAKNRHVQSEVIRVICDTIDIAQEGMDLAFAAGTLSTTAGIAREDSVRYTERYNDEEAKKARSDAKVGLKKALENLVI